MLPVASKTKIKVGCFTVLSFHFLLISTLKYVKLAKARGC